MVLTEDEFDPVSVPGRPLPSITIKDATALPAADELWAWAHVHVNRSLVPDGVLVSDDMATVLPRFAATLAENPDLAYSRLVSPRKLRENEAYHAFVVPTFESGRLSGPRARPRRDSRRDAFRVGRLPGPPGDDEPPLLPPLVLPHRRGGRLRVPRAQAATAAGRPARAARATSTCSHRARTSRRSPTTIRAACCRWAARCAYPARR